MEEMRLLWWALIIFQIIIFLALGRDIEEQVGDNQVGILLLKGDWQTKGILQHLRCTTIVMREYK